MKAESFENYPGCIIFVSNLLTILTCVTGAFIIYHLGIIWLALYLLYFLMLEVRLLKNGCVNCYYYGKFCAFGRGRISALLFKKGSPKKFIRKDMTWKDIIPDFLVSIIPVITGIVLLVLNFDWPILTAVIILIILATLGNSFVRGTLACKHCKQRQLGCPAEQIFNKKKVR